MNIKRNCYTRCYTLLSFVIVLETPEDCPQDGKNWTASGVKCYYFVPEQAGAKAFTFQAAKEQCKGYGRPVRWSQHHTGQLWLCFVMLLTFCSLLSTELLQPTTLEEGQYIVDYAPNVWTSNINVWLGMYYNTDGKLHLMLRMW